MVVSTRSQVDTKPANPRRRRYSIQTKRQIVAESFEPGVSVSQVSRRHDINANQVFKWRRLARQGLLEETGLVPIQVSTPPTPTGSASRSPGCLEINLADGHRLVVHGQVDAATLQLALASLR